MSNAIFWLCKGSRYWIVFVDPKGTEHVDYQRKINGYREVFLQDGKARVFYHGSKSVTVHLFIMTEDVARVPDSYREFSFDSVATLGERRVCGIAVNPCTPTRTTLARGFAG